jgi:hypothetical protein
MLLSFSQKKKLVRGIPKNFVPGAGATATLDRDAGAGPRNPEDPGAGTRA